MQSIFSGAKETWVWVGPEADESSKAVDLVNDLSHVYRHSCPAGDTSPETADKTRWGSLESRGLEDKLVALNHLLARDYWYRVWVVQEIALSKSLILFCGRRKFFWESLLFTAYLLNFQLETRAIHKLSRTRDPFRGVLPGIQRIMSIHSVRHDFQEELEKKLRDSLLCLLSNHRFTEATNPKDKYIALAGIAKVDHSKDDLYAQELEDVYELACKSLTKEQRHKPLDFLDCAGAAAGLPRNSCMPSWVPDWSITRRLPSPLLYWQFATKKHKDLVFINAPGKAHPSDNTAFSIREKGLLWAQGRKVDSIIREFNSVDCVQEPLDENPQDQMRVNSASHERPKYPTHEPPTDVLWKTLVQDRTPSDGRKAPSYWGDILYNYLVHPPSSPNPSFLQQWWAQSKRYKICGSTLEELAEKRESSRSEQLTNQDAELAHIKTSFTIAVGYRRLATTEKGYLCLVPQDAKAGDVVAILVDCSAPVVLRQRENEESGYEFIGTCYVHGIMHGEAMVGLNMGQRISNEFYIR
jgi:hypothetical protein